MFDYSRIICHIWCSIFRVVVASIALSVAMYLPFGQYTTSELIQQMEDDTMSNSTSSALTVSYIIVFYFIILAVMLTGYYITYLIIDCIRGNYTLSYWLPLPVILYMIFDGDMLWWIVCMLYHTLPYLTAMTVLGLVIHGITSTVTVYRECETE